MSATSEAAWRVQRGRRRASLLSELMIPCRRALRKGSLSDFGVGEAGLESVVDYTYFLLNVPLPLPHDFLPHEEVTHFYYQRVSPQDSQLVSPQKSYGEPLTFSVLNLDIGSFRDNEG